MILIFQIFINSKMEENLFHEILKA
jgi:hypothetical protein